LKAELPTSYVDSLPDKGKSENILDQETIVNVDDSPRGKGKLY